MFTLALRVGIFAGLAAGVVGCGGSSPTGPTASAPPSTPTPPPVPPNSVAYSGTFQTTAFQNGFDAVGTVSMSATLPAGSLAPSTARFDAAAVFRIIGDLVSAPVFAQSTSVTATGSLSFVGGMVHPLTGTYDTGARRFALSGQSFTVNATVGDEDIVTGTITHPGLQGQLVAMASAGGSSVITYVGSFSGPSSGCMTITQKGASLTAQVKERGEPIPFRVAGFLQGNSVGFRHTFVGGWTEVTGTLSGSTLSGTWRSEYTDPAAGFIVETGTWSARTSGGMC